MIILKKIYEKFSAWLANKFYFEKKSFLTWKIEKKNWKGKFQILSFGKLKFRFRAWDCKVICHKLIFSQINLLKTYFILFIIPQVIWGKLTRGKIFWQVNSSSPRDMRENLTAPRGCLLHIPLDLFSPGYLEKRWQLHHTYYFYVLFYVFFFT